jgi:hypothetical protein
MNTRAGVAVCFLRGYEGRAFRRSGYNFVWTHTRVSLEVGMEMENLRGCAYILPAPSLAVSRSFSLSFSSNSVGSLYSARFDVHPASHPHPPIHTRTAIALNKTGS